MFGTTDEVMKMRVKIMAWCRIRNFCEGKAVQGSLKPDRVVVGGKRTRFPGHA